MRSTESDDISLVSFFTFSIHLWVFGFHSKPDSLIHGLFELTSVV